MAKILAPVVLLVLVVAATLVTDRPLPRADFTFINRGDVNTLDLQKMSWMQDLRVARILFEGLVANDVFTHDYAIKPAAAESWEVSPDGLEYTFRIREDARWSNGQPVTAHDFVYSWRRAILPDTAADYTKLFQLIEGASEFAQWREAQLEAFASSPLQEADRQARAQALWEQTERAFERMVALRALDDKTLWVRLVRPTPYFLDLVAFAVFYPVYPPLVRQYERVDPQTGMVQARTGWTKPPHLVSNGPFMLTSWRFKRDMRFEQNPYYWNRSALNIETISTPSINDPNAAVLAYTTGVVDWVSEVTPAYRADMLAEKMRFYEENRSLYESLKAQGLDMFEIDRRLPDDPRKDIHAIPAFGTYWYNFNCLPTLPDGRKNPFADARVRRAFAMTVDKQSIVDDVLRLGNPVARTLIPPRSIGGYQGPAGLPCISDAKTPEERRAIVQQARDLLAQAGYADPREFPTVEILFNKDGGHDLIAQVVQKNWQEHLGVSVRLAQKEIKVFRDDLKNQNYMVSRAGWYGDYGDPTTFLDINRIDDGNNDRKYHNPRYEQLLDEAAVELDPQRRMALLSEAERISMEEDLPMVPLFHYMTVYLFDPDRISGLNPHPRTEQNVYLIDVLGDGKGSDRVLMMPPLAPHGAGPLPPRAGLTTRERQGLAAGLLDRQELDLLRTGGR
ncbi:MAG: ABC transporter substrate-binding protein [Phycisphaerales bacterium]|nr:MAG: ABC transporter substrate-binding protein [Phycisphaerales bacterium]